MSRAGARTLPIVACVFTLFAAACDRQPSAPAANPASSDLRIVSLSPAISRTLIDLELDEHIVGRTPYCDSIDQSLLVVGDLTNVNFEMLVRLNPTHILVQPPAGGVDPHLKRAAAEHGWTIAAWRLNGIDDIRTMLLEMPESLYAADSSERAKIRDDALRIIGDIDAAIAPTESSEVFRGRVLMVNDVNPIMAFGAGTYLEDILRALGGTNAVADRGWVQLSLEDVVRLAPEAIILVKPGASASDLLSDLGPLATIDVPAVKNRCRALLAHRDAMAPSSGVVGVAKDMQVILRALARGQ